MVSPSFEPSSSSSSSVDSKQPPEEQPEHGRKRVIVVASIPTQSENHAALKKAFSILKFPSLHYEMVFIADFKLLNIVFGLSTNAATYPCVYCEQSLLSSVSRELQLTGGKPRTVDSITRHNQQRIKRKHEQHLHRSCVAKPLTIFPKQQQIDEYVPLPPLHIFMGVTNWCCDLLDKCLPTMEAWPKQFYITRSDYHGNKFEGNACRRLLKDDSLSFLKHHIDTAFPQPRTKQPEALLILIVLQRFVAVRTACFFSTLQPNFEDCISDFKKAVLQLDVRRFPNKVHAICAHVAEWCELSGCGLGKFSEESFESAHYDFNRIWRDSYQIRDMKNPRYKSQHLQAVLRFNSGHIPIPEDL